MFIYFLNNIVTRWLETWHLTPATAGKILESKLGMSVMILKGNFVLNLSWLASTVWNGGNFNIVKRNILKTANLYNAYVRRYSSRNKDNLFNPPRCRCVGLPHRRPWSYFIPVQIEPVFHCLFKSRELE